LTGRGVLYLKLRIDRSARDGWVDSITKAQRYANTRMDRVFSCAEPTFLVNGGLIIALNHTDVGWSYNEAAFGTKAWRLRFSSPSPRRTPRRNHPRDRIIGAW